MPVQRKVIGTDPNGNPIYEGDAPTLPPPVPPTVTTAAAPAPSPNPTAGIGFGFPGAEAARAKKNRIDPGAELASSKAMAGGAYDLGMAQARGIAAGGAPSSTITAQQIANPGAIEAQQIAAPGMLGGFEAEALRAKQIDQAAAAAASPSAAKAQMAASQQAVSNQALGAAAGARGADRATARRDAITAIANGGQAASSAAAGLAAQEQAQKQAAYSAALAGVRSGDVGASQALTQLGAANQAANLEAQRATAGNTLTAGQANQTADLAASKATADNNLEAWKAKQAAQTSAIGSGIQATGAQNQAQQVAVNYLTGKNAADAQKEAALIGGLSSGLAGLSDERAKTSIAPATSPYDAYGGKDFTAMPETTAAPQKQDGVNLGQLATIGALALSDERTKEGIAKVSGGKPDPYTDLLRSLRLGPIENGADPFEKTDAAKPNPYRDVVSNPDPFADMTVRAPESPSITSAPPRTAPYAPAPTSPPATPPPGPNQKNPYLALAGLGLIGGMPALRGMGHGLFGLSDEDAKRERGPVVRDIHKGTSDVPKAPARAPETPIWHGGDVRDEDVGKLSDERAKQDVQKMDDEDRRHWADSIEPITWRYKPGMEDGGEDVHLGASAQKVEQSGPLGRLMVHEDPYDHLKRLDYGALTLMLSKTALDVANEALERSKGRAAR